MLNEKAIQVERESNRELRLLVSSIIFTMITNGRLSKKNLNQSINAIIDKVIRGQNNKIIFTNKKYIKKVLSQNDIKELKKELKDIISEEIEKLEKSYQENIKSIGIKELSIFLATIEGKKFFQEEKQKALKNITNLGEYVNSKAYSEISINLIEHNRALGYIWKAQFVRTRVSHVKMDNTFIPFGEIPVPGVYETFPNDRAVHPGEDYNCNCYMIIVFNIEQLKESYKGKIWKNGKIEKNSFLQVSKQLRKDY